MRHRIVQDIVDAYERHERTSDVRAEIDASTVFGADEQREVAVDVAALGAARAARARRGAGRAGADAELSLLFVDEQTIAELNERFLGGDRPDRRARVPDRRRAAARRPPARPGRPRARARRPSRATRRRCSATSWCARRSRPPGAGARRGTLDDELALLVVHGVLHLLDYDHAEPSESGGDAAGASGAARPLPRARARRVSAVDGQAGRDRLAMSGADWAIVAIVVVLFVSRSSSRWRRPRSPA